MTHAPRPSARTSAKGSRDIVIQTLVELADTLVDDFDVVDLLSLLTERCVEAFKVHDAGLMLAVPLGEMLRVIVSTSTVMHDVELYELQAREGPCLDCYISGEPLPNVRLDDTADRWPQFTPRAKAAGFRTVSALPMRLRGLTIGALNLFDTDDIPMTDDEISAARAFADVATIAVFQHQQALDARVLNEQLTHALNSRVIVEQAKGMLAERANLDVNHALERLRSHARRHNLRLAEVAQQFIDGSLGVESLTRVSSSPKAR